jgi:hypothetical protein
MSDTTPSRFRSSRIARAASCSALLRVRYSVTVSLTLSPTPARCVRRAMAARAAFSTSARGRVGLDGAAGRALKSSSSWSAA